VTWGSTLSYCDPEMRGTCDLTPFVNKIASGTGEPYINVSFSWHIVCLSLFFVLFVVFYGGVPTQAEYKAA
jgi:hypothetical protein